MTDSTLLVMKRFFSERNRPLTERFPGKYRAEVVETNDPLQMHRLRVKCPELHDNNLAPEQCPWAVSAFALGGKGSGQWTSPCIGDIVYISFEKGHPYLLVWESAADPTRRGFYPLPAVSGVTPIPVNPEGKPQAERKDYDPDYLPGDGRPMTAGFRDRYGNLDLTSSVGFFPSEHKLAPPPPDHDALQGADFNQRSEQPKVNSPDKKYMARITKYGNMFVLSDQGYDWPAEFTGNYDEDFEFESKRWLFLQKLLNEGVPSADQPHGDQRRIELKSRYGSRIEIRDVGWAQEGPQPSKTREGEFGPARTISKEAERDYRWIKFRTKGGMLIQAYDKGFDPAGDTFIKRHLAEESGPKSELEHVYFKDKDARFIRIVTRYGIKLVLDDRGSDPMRAHEKELPRGNGFMVKGRRTPGAMGNPAKGNSRGFFFEFNENDLANHSMWGSPMGMAVELNDRYQYFMASATMGDNWAAKFRGLEENEFIRKPMMMVNPEKKSHHLKLDHHNEYVRLKTRANKGHAPKFQVNPPGVSQGDINQGFEARDGRLGEGPWAEMVDSQNRGMWFSRQQALGIWRSRWGRQMYMWMQDNQRLLVIYNGDSQGRVQIYANASVDLISDLDINIQAGREVRIRAGSAIKMQAAGTKLTVKQNTVVTNKEINADEVNAFFCGVMAGPGAGCRNPGGDDVEVIQAPRVPQKISPTDRGKTYNQPFEECPKEEVEHPLA